MPCACFQTDRSIEKSSIPLLFIPWESWSLALRETVCDEGNRGRKEGRKEGRGKTKRQDETEVSLRSSTCLSSVSDGRQTEKGRKRVKKLKNIDRPRKKRGHRVTHENEKRASNGKGVLFVE